MKLMGTKDKLVERFKKLPKDFTFEEMVSLLGCFGYELHNGVILYDNIKQEVVTQYVSEQK